MSDTVSPRNAKVDRVSQELDSVEREIMAALLRIPTVLRPAMGGATQISVEGSTIGDVLNFLSVNYPAIKSQLLNDDGTLHRFLNVYINDDDVRYLGGVAAEVADDDEITLLPAVAGGVA